MKQYDDEDGLDGPWDRAMSAAIREDAARTARPCTPPPPRTGLSSAPPPPDEELPPLVLPTGTRTRSTASTVPPPRKSHVRAKCRKCRGSGVLLGEFAAQVCGCVGTVR